MRSNNEAQLLIYELQIRFDHKPRRCKKVNDSGIGTSQRIVCISDNTFFYYPKIQEFTDLDFDKLKYVVPKAGVKLQQIQQLKFPPRRNNQRNYFEISLPKNKILKYTKTLKEMIVDQSAEGQQFWRFQFDYDIISLPQLEYRSQQRQKMESQKMIEKRKKEQQENKRREQLKQKNLEQEYESLIQAQKALQNNDQTNQDNQYMKQKMQKQKKEELQKKLKSLDEFYFMQCYQKTYQNFTSMEQQLEFELDLLQIVGQFKQRAENVVRKYIDQMPYDPKPMLDTQFKMDNLFITIGDSKRYNHDFLDNLHVSHHLYEIRNSIKPNLRVPLTCFVKYKGFKAIIRSATPIDQYKSKNIEQYIQHGQCGQIWKTHFFLVDDLNLLLESMNLKPYLSQVFFQKVSIHLGTSFRLFQTQEDPFSQIKKLNLEKFKNAFTNKILYATNISQVYPIDLDLENNINQKYVRLRPQYINSYKDNNGQPIRLTGGGLTYQYQDEDGNKNDLSLAKASQNLKYKTILKFIQDLDQLEYVPMSSEHFSAIIKGQGINMRYLGNIYKLTSLPYIREMAVIQAICRELKKIYRDHQKQFSLNFFRENKQDLIQEAFNEKSMKSLQNLRHQQLRDFESNESMNNAIDFLNLVFGNSVQSSQLWKIILKKVKDRYKIQRAQYMDLPHGYMLKTLLYHCGFQIKLSSSVVLFATPNPFTIKDWIKFVSRSQSFTFPSMEVYKKSIITAGMTSQQIMNRLQLILYTQRILHQDQALTISKLLQFIPNLDIPGSKYSIANLQYYTQIPKQQKFETAFEICNFILPTNHPFFQDLYLQFASLKQFQPITLKKAAQNHAIRSLGLTHWKTSKILSGFKQEAYLKHLIAAQNGVETNKKLQLLRKIINEQQQLGKLVDSFNYVKKAISFVSTKKTPLSTEELKQYYTLLTTGIQVTYRLRKIQDMLKISEYFWNALELYNLEDPCFEQLQCILHYSMKAYMESSEKKYYLFKLALIFNDRLNSPPYSEQKQSKQYYLTELRICCRQAKNHINLIKQMLTKLEFGYSQINFMPDFFSKFWEHVERLQSQELDEGLYEISLFLRTFNLGFFEEALLNRSYTFDKGSEWDIPAHKMPINQNI